MKSVLGCEMWPQVITENGESVDSDLYKAIYHTLGNNRDEAVRLYFKVTAPSFIKDFQSRLSLNSQGQPTLESLLDIPFVERELNLNKDERLKNINKQFQGTYELDDALNKVQQFSNDIELSKMYVPHLTTITTGKDAGKTFMSITRRSPETIQQLKEYTRQAKFKQKVLQLLSDSGVAVDFAEKLLEQGNVDGCYNTRNPEKVFNSLWELIHVATANKVDEKITRDLCHEIGHFIVGAAENNNDAVIKGIYRRLAYISGTQQDNFKQGLLELRKLNDRNSSPEAKADEIEEELNEELDLNDREYLGQYVGEMLYSLKGKKDLIFDVSRVPKKRTAIVRLVSSLLRSMVNSIKNVAIKIQNRRIDKYNEKVGDLSKMQKHHRLLSIKDSTIKEINQDVQRLVNTFLEGELSGDDAILTQETRNKESLFITDKINSAARSLSSFITKYKDRGGKKEYVQAMEEGLAEVLKKRGIYKTGTRDIAIQGEIECMKELLDASIDIINEILKDGVENIDQEFIDSISNLDPGQLKERGRKLHRNINAVLSVQDFVKTFNSIESIIGSIKNDFSLNDLWDNHPTLSQFEKEFHEAGLHIAKIGSNAVFAIDQALLTTINGGKNYIDFEAGLVKKLVSADTQEYVHEEEKRMYIADLLSNFSFEDLGLIGTWIEPISRSTDIISQLHEKLVNYNKFEQNTRLTSVKRSMFDLRNYMRQIDGIDDSFDWMCETYDEDIKDTDGNIIHKKGALTGNVWQPRLWGKWEAELDRDIINERKRILGTDGETYIDTFDKKFKDLNPYEKKQYVKQKLNEFTVIWHGEHSIAVSSEEIDPDLEDPLRQPLNESEEKQRKTELSILYRYKPNDSYINKEWKGKELDGTKIGLINRYLNIKRSLDDLITTGRPNATRFYRLPQMRGSTMNRVYNKLQGDLKNLFDAGSQTLVTNFTSSFFEDCLDSDFGDLTCYTTEDQTVDASVSERFAEWRRRIPVYGVNKLPDGDISTDLIYSTMAYAVMATNVDAMHTASLVSQLGEEALQQRVINKQGGIREKDLPNHTNVFTRYTRWMDMEVFNKYQTRTPWSSWTLEERNQEDGVRKRKFLLNKLLSKLNGMISTLILAGRIPGAAVNLGTGIAQIFKEANIRDHFGDKELREALGIYFGGVAKQSYVDEIEAWKDFKGESLGKKALDLPSLLGLHKNLDYQTKLYSFIERFDAQNKNIQHFQEMHTRIPAWMRAQWGMWVYETGDHIMQTIPYLAKALATQLYTTDVDEENGLEESDMKPVGDVFRLFDESKIHKVSGQESIERRDPYNRSERPLYIKNSKGEFVKWDSSAEAEFADQCRYLVDDLHGVYNTKDAAAMSQNILGSMMLTMKKYYIGYWNNYFLGQRYSVVNGHNTQGGYSALSYLWGYNRQEFRRDVRNAKSAGEGSIKAYYKSAKKNLFRREGAMAVPVVASGLAGLGSILSSSVLPAIASSSAISFGLYSAYSILSKSVLGWNIFGKDIIKGNAEENLKDRVGMSKYQVQSLLKADQNVKKFLFLQMIAQFFAMGMYKIPLQKKEDDDKEELSEEELKERNKEMVREYMNTDAEIGSAIYKLLTGDAVDYVDLAIKYGIEGKDKDNIKVGGMAYNLIMRYLEGDPKAQYEWSQIMGGIYYFTKRLELEQTTLSPMMAADMTRGVTELKTQISELSRVLPVSMGFLLQQMENLRTLNEQGKPSFKYDKTVDDYVALDVNGNPINIEDQGHKLSWFNEDDRAILYDKIWGDNYETVKDEDGNKIIKYTGGTWFWLIPTGTNMGNLIMSLPGSENKGMRNMYFLAPYGNSSKFFMDTYKASDSWLKGRTLGG